MGTLTHSPADVIRNLIIDLAHGTAPSDEDDWPVYVGNEPDTPDNVITVYDTAGRLDSKNMTDGEVVEHPGFQVRVRSASQNQYYAGYNKIDAIAKALDAVTVATVQVGDVAGTGDATYTVTAATRTSSILAFGAAETGLTKRSVFTVNFIVALTQN